MNQSIDRDKLIAGIENLRHHDKELIYYNQLIPLINKLATYTESREVDEKATIDYVSTLELRDKAIEDLNLEIDSHLKELKSKDKEIEELRNMLSDCKLQLQYLSGKFKQTGTSNSLISRIKSQLSHTPPVAECQHPFTTYDDFAMMIKCSDCGKHLPNTKPITIEEAKDEVARKYNYNNWDNMIDILNQAGLNLLLEKRTNEAQDLYNTKQNNKPQYGFITRSTINDLP